MNQKFLSKYGDAFFEILFLRFYPRQIREFKIPVRISLYLLAAVLFYGPIFYSAASLCINGFTGISYFLFLAVLHIISKFIRANSQKVQQRFATVRTKKAFFMRVLLVLEYVTLMWIVYLIYPISCVLFPISMILIFIEKLLGLQFIYTLLTAHTDQYIFYGSLVSYILFILFDNYKRLLRFSMPGYLGLYAVLTVVSGFIDGALKMYLPDGFHARINTFTSLISQIFSLSNHALKLISSSIVFISAIFSLYANCGLDLKAMEETADDSEPSESSAT